MSMFGRYKYEENLHILIKRVCDCNLWEFLSCVVKLLHQRSKLRKVEVPYPTLYHFCFTSRFLR
jgi:hypothetical protein